MAGENIRPPLSVGNNYNPDIDPRLIAIIEAAADYTGFQVELKSGMRPGDKRQHGKGNALDITLIDPATGRRLPDYQDGSNFKDYERFAQAARAVQMSKYPELEKQLRWGGYFGSPGKERAYGAMDLMHFDLAGDRIGMAGGSWEGGLRPHMAKHYGVTETKGMGSNASSRTYLSSLTPVRAPIAPTQPRPQVMPAMLRTPNSADEVVRDFEDFRAEPYMDNGSWRVGFGSDTITRADGTVERVKPGMTVTRADAQRDLERRLPEFEQAIIKQVGTEAWNKLPREAQSAVKSMAYNYGSLGGLPTLVTAIKSGDLGEIADEVEARGSDNKGINRKRRTAEAALIRKGIAPTPAPRLASRTTPPASAPKPTQAQMQAMREVPAARTRPTNTREALQGIEELARTKTAARPTQSQMQAMRDVSGVTPAPKSSESPARTAKLPSGKAVHVGKTYRIGGETYIAGVDGKGAGTLKKVDAGILKEAGSGSIVGGMVDAAINETAASGIRQIRPAVTAAADAIGRGASDAVSAIGSGVSSGLLQAFERLGRVAAAKKSEVTLQDVTPKGPTGRGRPTNAPRSSSGDGGSAAVRLLQGGNVRTSGGIAGTAQLPRDVVPSSVLSAPAFKPAPKPTQAQMQAMRDVPKYLTKTRRVPIENEVKVAENNTLSAVPRGVVMNSLSRDSVAQKAAGAKAAQQLFRTETYQVPNPAYTEITVPYKAPAGPSPAQIEAARLEELRRIQAAYEAQKRAEMEAKKKQVKYLSNTNAEHRAALDAGSKGYTPSGGGGRVMPTRTISGKVRNSYGDSSSAGSNGSLVG